MYGHTAALGQTSLTHTTELVDQGYSNLLDELLVPTLNSIGLFVILLWKAQKSPITTE